MRLNISAPINNLSYGIVSKNIIDNLDNVALLPIGPIEKHDQEKYNTQLSNYFTKLNLNDPSLRIYHEFDLMQHIGKGPRVAFPFFERNNLDPIRKFNVKHQDLIFVASKWAKEVITPYQPNVEIANLGVSNIFSPDPTRVKRERITYINIGKREVRKGHDVLHKYFYEAFKDNDNVELWMLSNNIFDSQEETKEFERSYKELLGNKVIFFPKLPESDLVDIINRADIGVFLSRAEGWNMPLHECMACGKDIIATNYSAHTEFLPDLDGIYKIEPKMLVPAIDNRWFFGDFEWMDLNNSFVKEQIIYAFKASYKKQMNNRTYNKQISQHAKSYTWENTSKAIINGIQKLQ